MTSQPTTAYNFTIDDASPLIKYEPASFWDDNVSQDVNLPNYFQSSYHYSVNATAKASLTFTGTGVWVFGGRRTISGAYSIQIDNQPAQSFGPNPRDAISYQSPLGGVGGLPFGEHTIVVTNLSDDEQQPVLDIDGFIVQTAVDNSSGEIYNGPTVVDDANAQVLYSANGWEAASQVAPTDTQWTTGTVHESNVNGASVELSFQGQGLSINGAVGPGNGNFRVELDGKDMGEMSAKASILHPFIPLWFASNLTAGQHKVKLTNTGSDGDALTLDSYQVFTSTPANSDNSASVTAESVPAIPTVAAGEENVKVSKTSNSRLALIIGSIVGSLIIFGLLAFGILLYIRMRRRTASLHSMKPFSSTQPPPGAGMASLPAQRVDSRSSVATAVDVEAGLAAMEKTEKSTGWLDAIRRPKDKHSEPSTPPLPLQNYLPSPATPLPLGYNPILGTGGFVPSSDADGYLAPSGSRRAPSPLPTPPVIPALSLSNASPRSPKPPPLGPLPPPPVVVGIPPRGRQEANVKHGRAPSFGSSGVPRSRLLTPQEVRRSRSAHELSVQAQMAGDNNEVFLPRWSNRVRERDSQQSLDSVYTVQTTVEARAPPAVLAAPSKPREYAPYASNPTSSRSSLDSEGSIGLNGEPRRRAGRI